jgi:cbb3-type cytochrome oxidase subunit 3
MIVLLEWATLVSFIVFIAIIVWAYRKNQQPAFAEAAQLPFILPDEVISVSTAKVKTTKAGEKR